MLEENTYDEIPSGRVDTLVQAIERIERLEKQVEIAVEALSTISVKGFTSRFTAEHALQQIKELEK